MLKQLIATSALCICIVSSSSTQPVTNSVKQVVNNMFDAMRSADEVKFTSCFAEGALLQTIAKDKNSGEVSIKSENVKAFADQVKSLPKNAADERISFDVVKVDGDLAMVWIPTGFILKVK